MKGNLALTLLLACSGCAHTVLFDSQPQGATVVLDGQLLGTTPVTFVDRAAIARTYAVNLTKPGFRPRRVLLTQQVKLPTFCCPLLWLWAWELPADSYIWPLTADDGSGPEAPPGFLGPSNPPPE